MTLLTAGARRRTPQGPTGATYNVTTYVTAPTYDGSGILVHPDVVDFGAGTTWNGWRFWMAMTPYPDLNSAYENPSILVSSDGATWQVPAGLTNPVYPAPTTGWNSDTDLAYDPDTDELVLIFRSNDFSPRVARSADGVTWPATPTAPSWTLIGDQATSPAIVRISETEWHIWQVVKDTASYNGGPRSVYRWATTAPDAAWGTPTVCTGFPANTVGDPTIWHADVVRHDGQYWMLSSEGREGENPSAFHTATSLDGLAWSYGTVPVITEGSGLWDNLQLYRGTLQPHENGTHMRVWYGGRKGTGADGYRVGLTEIPLYEWPAPPQ